MGIKQQNMKVTFDIRENNKFLADFLLLNPFQFIIVCVLISDLKHLEKILEGTKKLTCKMSLTASDSSYYLHCSSSRCTENNGAKKIKLVFTS